jgi:glycosyltransferase involved in cell wall biosynthesis
MRLGIVYPRSNVDTVPSLVNAAEMFAESGYDVDLFTYAQAGEPVPTFASPRIRLRSLGVAGLADHSTAALRGRLKGASWLPASARAPLARGYAALGAGLAQGSRIAARARTVMRDRDESFVCVIGVDPDGLALAHSLARGAPVGYYSLELLLSYELTTASDAQLKARERELTRRAAFVIVQDEDRGRLLAEDNSIPWQRLVLVPNAPLGPARREPSRYWHSRFGLPADARVVIHSGSLGAWTGIEGIVEAVSTWPPGWVLVVHTRYDAETSSYVAELCRRADPRRVLFSLQPVPRQEYAPLIDGADVGVAFYVSDERSAFTQRNVQTIGLSSGKLAYYLRAGLPVVVNRASSIAEVVDAEALGSSVDRADEIGAALAKIAVDYEGFSGRATRFFDRRLDFGAAFAEVVRRVDGLR